MELTIRERLGIIQLLPGEGSYDELELVDSINEKINIFGPEQQEIGFFIDQQGFPAWKNDKTIQVSLTNRETGFIRERIRILDERKQITQFIFPACRKFGRSSSK